MFNLLITFAKLEIKSEMSVTVCRSVVYINYLEYCSTGWPLSGKGLYFSFAVLVDL